MIRSSSNLEDGQMDTPRKEDRVETKAAKRVILLEDLDGEEDIIGGASQKLFFGEAVSPLSEFSPRAPKG